MKGRDFNISRAVGKLAAFLAVAVLLSCAPGEEGPKPNVILIVIDALRQDHVGCYGYGRPTSPVMDALAAESIVFENTISHAPWTKTSFATMMTSLYPSQHGVTGWESIMPDSIVTLPEMLRESGYSTIAVINMLGISERFKVLDGVDIISSAAKYERDAVETTDDALKLLRDTGSPFFIIIHYFDVHWPYRPPPKYVDLIRLEGDPDPLHMRGGRGQNLSRGKAEHEIPDPESIAHQIMMYDGCIRFVDDNVARIMAFLEEEGLRDETAVLITADHGEAFWEHGFGSHGYDLHEESIRIPLIVSYPARYSDPLRVNGQVGLIDLLPTILDYAGAGDESHREGASLDDLIEGRARTPRTGSLLPGDLLLAESTLKKAPDSKCVRSNEMKAIVEPVTMRFKVYDLENDPEENTNLWGARSALGDSLMGLVAGVPGSRVSGWRVAMTGPESGARYHVEARVIDGGRLTNVDRVVAGGEFDLKIAADGTAFELTTRPSQQQMVLFDVSPPEARVRFDIRAEGGVVPATLFMGRNTRAPFGRVATLSNAEARGLPDTYDEHHRELIPGTFIWWLPGGEIDRGAEKTDLTDEEVQRLKSLGYIQ